MRLTEEIWKGKYTYAGKDKSTKEYDLWVDKAVQKLGELEDLEEQLGFNLTDIKVVRENSMFVTGSNEIYFSGDDFYGYYKPEEMKKVIKTILGEYLRCMREEK